MLSIIFDQYRLLILSICNLAMQHRRTQRRSVRRADRGRSVQCDETIGRADAQAQELRELLPEQSEPKD